MKIGKKVIVALDLNDFKEIIKLVQNIKSHIFGVKIGYEFFFNFGLEGYKKLKIENTNIFLDLKLHDIPNTVKKGLEFISSLNPYFTTIHISGGDQMIKSANLVKRKTKLLGVSALTSLDDVQIKKYYSRESVSKLVSDFTNYAIENKLDGIVCSPLEVKMIKSIAKNSLIIVTPGIRTSVLNDKDDQKRISGPGKTISLGADYLVIGRPITKSKNPIKKIIEINTEIEKFKN